MRNLLNPKWPFILNTIPVGFLLAAYIGFYTLVESQLSEQNTQYWFGFMAILLTLGLLHLAYVIISLRKNKELNLGYAVTAIIVYPTFIYAYWQIADEIFPSNIPSWMIPDNLPFYLSIALMPTIVHGIYVLVVALTAKASRSKAWHNLFYAAGVPVAWYVYFQLILPAWRGPEPGFALHVLTIFLVLSTVLFLFFVMRMVFIMTRDRRTQGKAFAQTWTIIFGMVFPLIGLLLNNGQSQFGLNQFGSNIFGNFTSPWYFIIVILNGLALFFSEIKNPRLRLALFVAKSIGFTYVLYFFLIFLPYLPLSVLFIIVFGAGLLMLSPLILMIIQGKSLFNDFEYLRAHFPGKKLTMLFVAGAMLLPVTISLTYWQDRQVLHQAMTYAFEDDSRSKVDDVSLNGLRRTLITLKSHKSESGLFSSHKPILTPLYTWLVLDNMTLSKNKIELLEEVFFGTGTEPLDGRGLPSRNINRQMSILSSEVKSAYHPEGYWISTIEFQIKNNSNRRFSEYVSSFELPEGTWIKDYYLDIEGRREHGILAEKKAATWLYQQIVRGQRDPGILYYLQGRRVAFRIFPFEAGQTRTTGIELIHKEAIDFNMGELSLTLGKESPTDSQVRALSTTHGHYLSKSLKARLPLADRKPYFHFLLDCSVGNENRIDDYLEQARHIFQNQNFDPGLAKISYVNSSVKTTALCPSEAFEPEFTGGFFLEKAMKQALADHFMEGGDFFPVFVVLSNDLPSAVFTKNLADYTFCSPETDKFFSMGPNGQLKRHSFINAPLEALEGGFSLNAQFRSSRKWTDSNGKAYYVADNEQPTVIPDKSVSGNDIKPEENWLAALDMQAQWQRYRLSTNDPQKHWLRLIKSSFQSQIMNPTTSFLALENESQKELLRRKQEQVLSGKQSFDLGDDVQRMSEPSWWILLLAMGLILFIKKFR
ncbi:MAG: MSEP-CTERM sorting domain-containing protein [Roseivirga sp.]|nr:MSEP-CTERM sorting domain-containing protein [Roseivirga sp.]